MTIEDLLSSKRAFCVWISYLAMQDIRYSEAEETIDCVCSLGKGHEDVTAVLEKERFDEEWQSRFRHFIRYSSIPGSTIDNLTRLNDHFIEMLLVIRKELLIKQRELRIIPVLKTAIRYFAWLMSCDIKNCSEIDSRNTLEFLKELARSNSFMNTLIPQMRKIFRILLDNGYTNVPDTLLGYKAAPKRNLVLPAFTEEEVDSILLQPDCSTFFGFRDFSILSLISMTGFRPVDVRNLKLENIDFKASTINIVQSKTGVPLKLPMDRILSKILSIYVQRARQVIASTNNDILFPSSTDCRKKMSERELHNHFASYMKQAGIESNKENRKGLYTFRRTMGKWLLESGSHPEMIASVLGHRDLSAFKHYVSISPSTLKQVALDFRWTPVKEVRSV